VRDAAQSFFDEEEALRLAEQDRARQAEVEARLAEARRVQEEAARAQREGEAERQRLEAAERERQKALERARQARQITAPPTPAPTTVADQLEPDASAPPEGASWLSRLTVIVVWTICGPFPFGRMVAGFVTAMILRRQIPSMRLKHVSSVTLGWVISEVIFLALFPRSYLNALTAGSHATVTMEFYFREPLTLHLNPTFDPLAFVAVGGTAGGIAGLIGGLITGLVLRRVHPSISQKQVVQVSLGWAVGLAIGLVFGGAIGFALSRAIGVLIGELAGLAIGGPLGLAISGSIAGAVGGGWMFRQLRQTLRES